MARRDGLGQEATVPSLVQNTQHFLQTLASSFQGGFVRREVRSGVWIKRSPDVTREGERELSLIL